MGPAGRFAKSEHIAKLPNEIHMTGRLATPGYENGMRVPWVSHRIESVPGRAAGNWNGAPLVPETKLARLTCGTPDWSR